MKKLMIAACVIACAAVTQAASYTWSALTPNYTWNSADPDWPQVADGTSAYFVFAAEYGKDQLVSDFNSGSVNMTALDRAGTGTLDGGQIDVTAATGDYTSNQSVYYVIFDDGKMFISGNQTAIYDEFTMTGSASFGYDEVEGVWTGFAYDASAGYGADGWYAQSVPEPTSGLLLLLGMAGLALRRRRA